jgi:hypothetical protein
LRWNASYMAAMRLVLPASNVAIMLTTRDGRVASSRDAAEALRTAEGASVRDVGSGGGASSRSAFPTTGALPKLGQVSLGRPSRHFPSSEMWQSGLAQRIGTVLIRSDRDREEQALAVEELAETEW